MLKRIIACFMLSCMVFGTIVVAADSHIVVDPTAPGNQRPQIIGTGSGLPQVNITTPNGNGLSYNRYGQFDVGKQGVILNNATQNALTQLGGWIEKNPNLSGGSANLIVNEVNSSNPSRLNGFVEIAGKRADVVIANPSGISVDGGGFINANRATLTTGIPRIENGNLVGYDVTGGRIDIQGAGLNARGANYADIVAEAVAVNAGIWANQLNVATGRNFVSRDMSQVVNIDPDAETGVTLDVKAIGGMYANEIRLVGTGRGLGVNSGMHNEGNIYAQVGEVVIDQDGMLSSSGVISGNAGAKINAGGEIVNTGTMQSAGELVLTGGQSIDNQGDILADGGASLTTASDFNNDGYIQSRGGLSIVASEGSLTNQGEILSVGETALTAKRDFINTGNIHTGGDTSIEATEGGIENRGQLLSEQNMSLHTAGNIDNYGKIKTGEKLSLKGANLNFDDDSELLGLGGIALESEGDFLNSGVIESDGDLDVVSRSGSIVNEGRLTANESASFAAGLDFQNKKSVQASENLDITVGGEISNVASLKAGGTATLVAGKGISNTADLHAGGGMSLTTLNGDLFNSNNILTNGDFAMNITGNLMNKGEIGGGGLMQGAFSRGVDNTGRILAGAANLAAGSAFVNTGLIDGGEIVIRAGSIENINTGTILGDHLALQADTFILNGLPLGVSGEGTSGLIGARNRLDLAARDITNREDGVLYSAGDIHIGGTLDANGFAIGRAGTLVNASALIDAGGSIWAAVDQFTNRNDHYKTELRVTRDERFQAASLDQRTYYRPGELGTWWNEGDDAVIGGVLVEDFYIHDVHIIEKDTFVTESRPGTIYTGGNFVVDGSLTNDHSRIVSGGTIQVAPSDKLTVTGSFNNIAAMEPHYYEENQWIHFTEVVASGPFGGSHERKHYGGYAYNPPIKITHNEKDVVLNPYQSSGLGSQTIGTGANSVDSTAMARNFTLNLNANLYTMNPSPTSNYLVETNPRLTDYRTWLSSDFMIQRLASDPSAVLKRLGDGYYEQRLIREQISYKTGQRYLEGFSDDEAQYEALMLAGVDFAEEFQVALGVTLSADLIARLTSDIVWMEYVTVDTPSGPQQVLSPTVYLAPGRESKVNAAGTIASAKNINLDLNGDFNNSGNVLASNTVSVKAGNINNEGNLAGKLISLAALKDINNIGGRISGEDAVDMRAGNDITIAGSTQTAARSGDGYSGTMTTLDRTGSVETTGKDSSLSVQAGRDLNINAAQVSGEGDVLLAAGRDVNIGVVKESLDYTTRADAQNGFDLSKSADKGSVITAGKGLDIKAENDVLITGGIAAAVGDVNIQAGNDVVIAEGRQTDDFNSLLHTVDDGFWSTTTTTRNQHTIKDNAVSSTVSGDKINISAGKDFTLQGSSVAASDDVSVKAGGDITVKAADTSSYNYAFSETTKEGFSGSLSKGTLSISYGEAKSSSEKETTANGFVASGISSVGGSVDLYADKDVTISASNVTAGKDIGISGENMTIKSLLAKSDGWQKNRSESYSIGLTIGLGGTIGNVISSAYTLDDILTARQAAKAQNDSTINTIYDLLALRSGATLGKNIINLKTGIDNAVKPAELGQDPKSTNIFAPSNGNFGLNIEVGLKTSSSKTDITSNSSTSVGGKLQSGGDTTIVARGKNGDETGTGDLNIAGSSVAADGKVILTANNDINLLAGENSSSNKTTTDSLASQNN